MKTTTFKCPLKKKKKIKSIINVKSTAKKALSSELPEQAVCFGPFESLKCVLLCEPHTIIALPFHCDFLSNHTQQISSFALSPSSFISTVRNNSTTFLLLSFFFLMLNVSFILLPRTTNQQLCFFFFCNHIVSSSFPLLLQNLYIFFIFFKWFMFVLLLVLVLSLRGVCFNQFSCFVMDSVFLVFIV